VAGRTERAEDERVVERFRLMRNARSDVQHFPFPQRHFLTIHEELERALQDIRHLLAFVGVLWHDGAAFQVNLRQGLPLSRHELSGNHLGDFFERNFVPTKETIREMQDVFGSNYSTRIEV
jgi:hypothetical protein